MLRRPSIFRICGTLLLLPCLAAGQGNNEPTFKAYSKLVQVSVIVKRSGKHVGRLSKDDFVLLENGKQQAIATFEEFSSPASLRQAKPAQDSAKTLPGSYTNASPGNAAITVLVIDAINTGVLDQTYARQHLLKFLKETKFPAGQSVGLMVSARSGLKVIHHFTTDVSILTSALREAKTESSGAPSSFPSTATSEPASPLNQEVRALEAFAGRVDAPYGGESEFQCEMAVRDTIRALRGLAQSLQGFPGRKTVLWTTAGFNFSCPDAIGIFAELSARAFRELADANVSIYPVDARGLLAYDFMSAGSSMSGAQARNPGAYNRQKYSGWFNNFRNSVDSLKHTAEKTGGIAFFNTNDLSGAMVKARGDAGDYYVLGYYARQDLQKTEWRNIEVKSRLRGLDLRHRNGVYLVPAREGAKPDDLNLAQVSPLDFSALEFSVTWPAGTPPNHSEYELGINPQELTLSPENQMSLDLLVVERTDSGEVQVRESKTIAGKIKDVPEFLSQRFRLAGRIEPVTPGRNIRFIVRDNLSERMGSITVKARPSLPPPSGAPR
ncbi:MAG: VWA domain-containing protein [Terriglobales bacterium]